VNPDSEKFGPHRPNSCKRNDVGSFPRLHTIADTRPHSMALQSATPLTPLDTTNNVNSKSPAADKRALLRLNGLPFQVDLFLIYRRC
jgi:hypothetical protein